MSDMKSETRIPLMDLKAQYLGQKDAIDAAIHEVLDSAYYIEGPKVAEFERNFARYCEVTEAVGLDSGTAALQLGFLALDLKPGDELIMPANTFIATAAAAAVCGIRCVFVDSDDRTWQMDVEKVKAAITSRTKGVVAVHLYGQPVAVGELRDLCATNGLYFIEDAAQAHGALFKGQRIGSFGHFAAFSCYPAKNLGAFGDGGVLTTNDARLAERVRRLRNHGRLTKYEHSEVGFNYRMDALQGAVLNIKLSALERWNEGRRRLAMRYRDRLASLPLRLPEPVPDTVPVFHLFTVNLPQRDALAAWLTQNNIETGVHYPVPLHLQPAFSDLGYRKGDFPVAERIARETLSLPIFAEMTDQQFNAVCVAVETFFQNEELSAPASRVAAV